MAKRNLFAKEDQEVRGDAIGKLIKKLRNDSNLTQQDLADKVKMLTGRSLSLPTIKRIEGGQEPHATVLLDIVIALDPANAEHLFYKLTLCGMSNYEEVLLLQDTHANRNGEFYEAMSNTVRELAENYDPTAFMKSFAQSYKPPTSKQIAKEVRKSLKKIDFTGDLS